jgi:hypothetical protein
VPRSLPKVAFFFQKTKHVMNLMVRQHSTPEIYDDLCDAHACVRPNVFMEEKHVRRFSCKTNLAKASAQTF